MIPHHDESLSPVIYLVQTQVSLIPNSTQKRQLFLINHLPLAVFSTPLNFKICPSPQSRYSVLSVLPHRTPSQESLDSKRGGSVMILLLHSHDCHMFSFFSFLCLYSLYIALCTVYIASCTVHTASCTVYTASLFPYLYFITHSLGPHSLIDFCI